jgi:transposase
MTTSKPLTQVQLGNACIAMFKSGLTTKHIAYQLGVSVSTVRRWIRAAKKAA